MAYSPLTTERERDEAAELELLESIWAASPDEPARESLWQRVTARLGEHLGWILAISWLAFIVSLFAAPAGDPNAVVPLWAEIVIAGFFLGLGTTGVLAAMRTGRSAYAASTIAGAFGIALAAACGSTEHHAAGWWGYELGATIALTGLSIAGFTRRRKN